MINFTCTDCPTGADCRTDNQTRAGVVPLAGYYADVSKANDMFVRCYLPSSCVGGTKVCAPPYVGPLCSGCDVGFHINTDWSCSKYVFAFLILHVHSCYDHVFYLVLNFLAFSCF